MSYDVEPDPGLAVAGCKALPRKTRVSSFSEDVSECIDLESNKSGDGDIVPSVKMIAMPLIEMARKPSNMMQEQ